MQSAPGDTPNPGQVRAPNGALETEAPRADTPANPHLAGLTMPVPMPDVGNTPHAGSESPPGGNGLPVQSAGMPQMPSTPAQFAAAGPTTAVAAPGDSATATGDAMMPRAMPAPNPASLSIATRSDVGAAVTSMNQPPPSSATERVVEAPRAEVLRAGILDSMSAANEGANLTGEQRDAQTGGRQPDPVVQLIPTDRQMPAPATPTAEFSLNAGPTIAPTPELQLASPASGTGAGTDALTSGQRPLQPLGDQTQWAQGLGQRLLLMADGEVQTARMRLHPESLGRLDVRIEIEGDTARVWFNANSVAARDAIESALPRLREMFDASGLELLGTDVSGDGPDYHAERDASPEHFDAIADDRDHGGVADLTNGPLRSLASARLLDVYA
ncbi:MAG: flagellar hook-length control protein FliK [Gammaproteobacteria bacterium]